MSRRVPNLPGRKPDYLTRVAKKRATPRNGSAGAETEPVIIVRKPKKLIRPPP
jgi:hypothetical protein